MTPSTHAAAPCRVTSVPGAFSLLCGPVSLCSGALASSGPFGERASSLPRVTLQGFSCWLGAQMHLSPAAVPGTSGRYPLRAVHRAQSGLLTSCALLASPVPRMPGLHSLGSRHCRCPTSNGVRRGKCGIGSMLPCQAFHGPLSLSPRRGLPDCPSLALWDRRPCRTPNRAQHDAPGTPLTPCRGRMGLLLARPATCGATRCPCQPRAPGRTQRPHGRSSPSPGTGPPASGSRAAL